MITSSLAPGVIGAMPFRRGKGSGGSHKSISRLRDVMSVLRSERCFAVISTSAVSRFRPSPIALLLLPARPVSTVTQG
jgi:hypothetical protein